MPILAIFTGVGITKKLYESMRKDVKWESKHPQGAMVHACAFDDSGFLHVVDVWASAAALNKFVKARLIPSMKKFGVPPPKVATYRTHKVIAYPGIKKFVLSEPKR